MYIEIKHLFNIPILKNIVVSLIANSIGYFVTSWQLFSLGLPMLSVTMETFFIIVLHWYEDRKIDLLRCLAENVLWSCIFKKWHWCFTLLWTTFYEYKILAALRWLSVTETSANLSYFNSKIWIYEIEPFEIKDF